MNRTIAALSLALFCTLAFAQTPQITRVRGEIEKLDGNALTVKSRDGSVIAIHLAANATVSGVVPASLADITAGKFIGVTGMPRPDGTQLALEIHVFPESMRGVGEGHRAWDLKPESTMTNATVADVVSSSKDRMLTLRYKEGEQKVFVPEAAPIVTYVPADRSALKPGAHVFVIAQRAADGTLSAPRVSVGLNGLVPPM